MKSATKRTVIGFSVAVAFLVASALRVGTKAHVDRSHAALREGPVDESSSPHAGSESEVARMLADTSSVPDIAESTMFPLVPSASTSPSISASPSKVSVSFLRMQ